MATVSDIFSIAAHDEPALLIAALPTDTSPPDVRDGDGASLLLHCLYRGLEKNLAALRERCTPLPLHEAAALGEDAAVSDALTRAPDALRLLSPDGWSALHLAAFFGHASTVTLLLARGADANLWSRAFERNLPLHAACAGRAAKPDVVRALIPATVDLDARQGGGWTPLMLAAVNGMAASVDLLLAAGANAALVNDKGKPAAELARDEGHAALAARLAG